MDLTSDERRRLGMQALEQTLAYFDAADEGPVYPRAGADELGGALRRAAADRTAGC